MKELYMELYYTMDGCIPPGYDLDAYLYQRSQELKLEEEEYEHTKKASKNSVQAGNKKTSSEERGT